ncbi:MAG TPA: hypothetical protein VNU92_01185 [Edaphobacter sp.]|jgi:hypothetical protein|nr:hypothetical protein [Edaphobacter sp.]
MVERRNIFLHGLSLTLRRFPALLWTYIFNLGLAFLFSIGLNHQLSSLLNHSLAAQRLSNGFDLGIVGEVLLRFNQSPVGEPGIAAGHASIPLYLLIYFILVPGTLFCYLTSAPARLGTMFQQGLLHFWRFVRITILFLIAAALILQPLNFFQTKWSDFVDDRFVGRPAFLCISGGYIIVFVAATVLRLYFDLVEVYTVQLGLICFSNGKPDRRVHRTLRPALRTLFARFAHAWPIFIFLTLLGLAAVVLTARVSMHMLAQPIVWPSFLLAQLGLFLMLFTRFWQRGVETALALQNPIALPIATVTPLNHSGSRIQLISDPISAVPEPISDPEPAPPSLDEPDPGVFHHDPKPPL